MFSSCDYLTQIVDEPISALDPGLQAQGDVFPPATANAHHLLETGGTVCGWSNPATSETLLIGYVQLDKETFTTEKKAIAKIGTPSTTFGSGPVQAFQVNAGTPTTLGIDVFTTAGYWISTQSHLYTTADTAQPAIMNILHALPTP